MLTLNGSVVLAGRLVEQLDQFPITSFELAKKMNITESAIEATLHRLARGRLIVKRKATKKRHSKEPWLWYLTSKPSINKIRERFISMDGRIKRHKKDLEGPELAQALTKRKCRECSQFLPATRYFKCETCQPNLPTLDDDYIYGEDFQWGSEDDEIFLGYPLDTETFSSDYRLGKDWEKDELETDE